MAERFGFRVAGISYCQEAAECCGTGDPVRLVPEPENPFDPNAIRVEINGRKVGYVPRDLTGALRSFAPDVASASASVRALLGGGAEFLTGIEVDVGPCGPAATASSHPASVRGAASAQETTYVVLKRALLHAVLYSILYEDAGSLPFPLRIEGRLLPARTKWLRRYDPLIDDDVWAFEWRDDQGVQRLEVPGDSEAEVEILTAVPCAGGDDQ